MDPTEIENALDAVFDQAIVFHAFTDYLRDYEVVFSSYGATAPPTHHRYVFKHCVEAQVSTSVSPEHWRRSLADYLIERAAMQAPQDGYVWGVRWQENYPGGGVVHDSATAQKWTNDLGVPFHEVSIEANAHALRLVFSDLEVHEIGPGYAPFTLDE